MGLGILEKWVKQQISNEGYADGLNSVTPNHSYSTEEAQEIYDQAYEKGPRAAIVRANRPTIDE